MTGNAIDSYEDMFKEITRKLYGEDGLPELGASERTHASASDRGLTPIDYDIDTPMLKPEEHLTAFGLAALMQNGFPSPFQQHKPNPNFEDKWIISEDHIPWTQSKIASYNPAQKLFRCAECDCVGYLPRVAEHWLGTHSNLRVFQCPQCPYESAWARCVRMHLTRQHNIDTEETTDALLKNNPVLQEVTRYLQRLKTRLESTCHKPPTNSSVEEFSTSGNTNHANTNSNRQQPVPTPPDTPSGGAGGTNKRYTCSYCPYATDRRDLFTRHENIHREEKPFQCYVCQKQFNRADHVKKHFLRMHREHVYDLNRIRRHPPKNASGMSYYQKYNSSTTNGDHGTDHHSAPGVSNPAISIPNSFNNINRNLANMGRNNEVVPSKAKNSSKGNGSKKKGEKRFSCCYCSWSGVDNWCLKRHMNTHLKPFVCGLCDYKAARSERLATHVLKVHNKRACSKCTFMADDQQQLTTHQAEHHPMEQRRSNNTSSAANNVLRNTSFANSTVTSGGSFGSSQTLKSQDLAAAALLHGQRLLHGPPPDIKPWKPHIPKQHGAARLFNYMEASDGSEPECDSSCGAEDMSRLSHRVQSDFLEAGDVGGGHHTPDEDEPELPLFVCPTCGCEFEDDASLATHRWTHARSTASPAKRIGNKQNNPESEKNIEKENLNPMDHIYQCKYEYCNASFTSQKEVITHMSVHSTLNTFTMTETVTTQCKQRMQPKKHLTRTLYCVKCPKLRKFQHRHNLILHYMYNHTKQANIRIECEHCSQTFNHKYQMILHASKAHANDTTNVVPANNHDHNHLMMMDQSNATLAVPDHSTFSSASNVHKLGMYFDHSFNNGHMSLIIPTFPPN